MIFIVLVLCSCFFLAVPYRVHFSFVYQQLVPRTISCLYRNYVVKFPSSRAGELELVAHLENLLTFDSLHCSICLSLVALRVSLPEWSLRLNKFYLFFFFSLAGSVLIILFYFIGIASLQLVPFIREKYVICEAS